MKNKIRHNFYDFVGLKNSSQPLKIDSVEEVIPSSKNNNATLNLYMDPLFFSEKTFDRDSASYILVRQGNQQLQFKCRFFHSELVGGFIRMLSFIVINKQKMIQNDL